MKRIAIGLLLATASGPAWGQSCASLPYTLTNGTVANADQVMANMNCLALKGNGVFTGDVTVTKIDGGSEVRPLQLRNVSTASGTGVAIDFDPTNNGPGVRSAQISAVTNGSNQISMIFRTSNSAPTTEVMRLTNTGRLGIGTTTPAYLLSVNGTAGGTSGWQISSDGRLKTNIMPVTGGLALIERLNPVRYEWRKPADRAVGKDLKLPVGERQIGFIAQEVEKVVPEAVTTPAKGSAETYGLKQDNLIPVLVAAIKELQEQIKALQDQVAALKAQQ